MKKVNPRVFVSGILHKCQDMHSVVRVLVRLHWGYVCGFMSGCQRRTWIGVDGGKKAL